MSVQAFIERRRHIRCPIVRPCKVRDGRSTRFLVAKTSDLSDGGALIQLERTRPLGPGDELELFVADDRSAVIPATRAVRATVRRVVLLDPERQSVALEFVTQQRAAEEQLVAA